MDKIHNAVLEFIASAANVDKNDIQLDKTFEDYEIDSILFIRLVIQLEADFDLIFEDDMLTIEAYSNLGEFIEYVTKANK